MPAIVEVPTLIVKADVAVLPDGGVIGLSLKLAVTPVGAPEIVSVTAELNSFREVTVMLEVPDPPFTIVREFGDADIEKSGAALTVSVTVVLCASVSVVPVTVSV